MGAELARGRGSSLEGLCRVYRLPDATLTEDWDRIFVGPEVKRRLIGHARVLTRLAQANSSVVGLGLRRALLLYGPPGGGKTSLAYGLPNEWARRQDIESVLIVANTHAIRSGELGKTEKQVTALFDRIHEIASAGMLTFVVIDEVESIASDRAMGERVDFALEITLPEAEQRELILVDALAEVDRLFDRPAASWSVSPQWPELLRVTSGLSGRQLRHLAVAAMTLVDDEGDLQVSHLVTAAVHEVEQRRRNMETGGVYTHAYQRPAGQGALNWKDGAAMQLPAEDEMPTGSIVRMDDAPPAPNSADSAELIETEDEGAEQDPDGGPNPDLVEDGLTETEEAPTETVGELDSDANEVGEVPEILSAGEENRDVAWSPLRSVRHVAAVPKRSADGAWTATADLVMSMLEARGYVGAANVAEDLERLRPLGRNLLTVHALEHGRTEFATGDLLLEVNYDYSVSGEEDVSLPPVEALGPLPDGLVPTLTFYVDRFPKDPFLGALVDEVTDTGRLAVRVVGPEQEV